MNLVALRRLLPGPDAGEGRVRFGVRLLVAVLCAGALVQAVRPAWDSVSAGVGAVDGYTNDAGVRTQMEYIGAEIHRQVPRGTRVVIVEPDQVWSLRLAELATLQGAEVVLNSGELELSRVADPAAPHGVRVVVRRPATG